jgi:hypothetical protein
MRRFAIFWSVLIIFGAAMATYVVSLQVGVRYERVKTLKKQMRADADAIRMLETELTYRASPQRLQALVDAHGLQLAQPKADQYLVSSADLAPQPGDVLDTMIPQPRETLPQFADASPYAVPVMRAKPQAPVQLASLGSSQRIVAFAEPVETIKPLTETPVLQSPRAVKAADAVVPEKQKATVSAAASASAQKSEQKKKEPVKKDTSKKEPVKVEVTSAVVKKPQPAAEKPKPAKHVLTQEPAFADRMAVAKKPVEKSKPVDAPAPKPDAVKPSAAGGLNAALIASIRTEAAKESEKQ